MTDKKEPLKWLYASAAKYFLPLLLGAVVMNVIFGTYYDYFVKAVTAGFVVYECVLFWFFEKIKKRKGWRFFIYTALGLVILVLSGWLIGNGWQETGVSFIDWFYVNSQEVGSVTYYNAFIFVGMGFFIISILYYFTVYRFRIFGVMLTTMFPFVIYGKRAQNINTLSQTFMMTVFLAMMIHQKRVADDYTEKQKRNIIMNRSYAIGISLFVTFVGAITMLIPKPAYKSQLEANKGVFKYYLNSNTTDYDDLNDVSSPRFGANSTGEILFTIDDPKDIEAIYMRRQSFDLFRANQWVLRDEYRDWYGAEDGTDNIVNSPLYMHKLLKSMAATGRYEDLGLTEDLFGNEYKRKAWLNLSGSTYSPSYIPAPLMADTESLDYGFRNVHGEFYYKNRYSSAYGGLGVSYGCVAEESDEYAYVGGLPFSWESFEKLMTRGVYYGDVSPEDYSQILSIFDRYTEKGGVTERIDKLAKDITKDCKTDFEKCSAIVDYFEDNGYIYDLEYIPDDESIDYFLFESKTGVCTSYATSMVLMARALDIPTRYVEGFAAYERNDDGDIVVRDSHAHAFVEAYIPGAGWVTFDPTVPDYRGVENYNNNNAANVIRTFMDYFSKIALFLGVVFVLVFVIFLDRIIEFFFRIRMKFRKTTQEKSMALYERIVRLLEISSDKDKHIRGMTPGEILAMGTKRGAEISRAVSLFEQVCFGGYKPADVEFEAAYSCYKQSWKALAGKNKAKTGNISGMKNGI
ncbi:transglutaminase [Ruminococcus albus SY3]|uniref:Transglutaminase n=1 Tax=Ruminococcus albus SY3 TaxID=1341156 RepID=A0A011UY55_RUMAL|nr:transglutaminase domain-containing protein [Ruminococcus albus]EXM38147.1 transglutaminase [Ruminococcus albus SY3]